MAALQSPVTTATNSLGSASASSPTSRNLAIGNFLASDRPIRIVPSFTTPSPLPLCTTREPVGPFRAGVDVSVPLWVALTLRRRRLCRIVPPHWLDADFLRDVLEYERDTKNTTFSPYSDLPVDYVEIARAVLNVCSTANGGDGGGGGGGEESDVPRGAEIASLLEDVEDVRMDRIRGDVHRMSRGGDIGSVDTLNVTGMSRAEMARVRPILVEAFRGQRELSGRAAAEARAAAAEAAAETPGDDGASGRRRGAAADAAADAASSSRRAQLRPSRTDGEGDGVVDEDEQEEGPYSGRSEQDGDGVAEEGGQTRSRDGEAQDDGDGESSSSLPIPPRSSRIRRFR